jgi:hypothetical protein
MSGNDNPRNFANRPKEEVQEIASKGGQASHNSGYASIFGPRQAGRLTSHSAITNTYHPLAISTTQLLK